MIKSSCDTVIIKLASNSDTVSITFIITLGCYYKDSTNYQIPIRYIYLSTGNNGDTVKYYHLNTTDNNTDFYQRLNSWFTSAIDSSTTEFTEPNIYTIKSTPTQLAFLNNMIKFFSTDF